MTAAVIDLRTRQPVRPRTVTIHPATPWWTCPSWCDGNCDGGETERFPDGHTYTHARAHERTLYATTGAEDGRSIDVELAVGRYDDYDAAVGNTEITLRVGDSHIQLTAAHRRELAAALLAASELDDSAEGAGAVAV